ncbi:MAG: tRNA threonylcarbamoyladenosine dehydratase [Alphaproteobacteria bacterium]|nr:tRNA threonylcarbamoyladenosine dehydratase [Alphaproteobacteria bacterium]
MDKKELNSLALSESCLQNQIHNRTELLLGKNGLDRLAQSHVMVIGCGAVGGMAIEALARSGVGCITVVDCDVFSPSNLNRQILATTDVMNQSKTHVATQRIHQIDSTITVIEKNILVSGDNVETLFNEPVDFVIDAIDSLNAKTTVIAYLVTHHIPFISSMGAALKTDITRIQITQMKKTIQCPLASFLRKRLRRRGIDMSFRVVYSDECVSDKLHLGEEDSQNNRRTMGSMMTVTGIFGLMCAHYVIMKLIQTESKTDE